MDVVNKATALDNNDYYHQLFSFYSKGGGPELPKNGEKWHEIRSVALTKYSATNFVQLITKHMLPLERQD